MGMAALAEPQAIRISSKRQITIPAKIYKNMGFNDYALCTWTEQGLFLQPLDVEDEDISVGILRDLVKRGYGGDDLIEQYKETRSKIRSLSKLMAEKDRKQMLDPNNRNISDEDLFGC